ncbi:hypothetical protein ACQ4PT_057261 [Festuca glaucescens]
MTEQPRRRSPRLQRQGRLTVLLVDLHQCIGERLSSNRDIANFRLSDNPLRDAALFADFAPVLMLPIHPDGAVSFYWPTDGETLESNLAALHGKVVCGSSRGWLALVDVAANVTLLNPFTGATADLTPANNCLREACFRRVSIDFGRCQCILHYQGEPEV